MPAQAALISIGSGPSAKNIRNYQPMLDLGRAVGDCREMLEKSVRRKQSDAGREDRFFQVKDSIKLTGRFRKAVYYVILEDVFTTGSTANEASRILKLHSSQPVYVVSLFMAD